METLGLISFNFFELKKCAESISRINGISIDIPPKRETRTELIFCNIRPFEAPESCCQNETKKRIAEPTIKKPKILKTVFLLILNFKNGSLNLALLLAMKFILIYLTSFINSSLLLRRISV